MEIHSPISILLKLESIGLYSLKLIIFKTDYLLSILSEKNIFQLFRKKYNWPIWVSSLENRWPSYRNDLPLATRRVLMTTLTSMPQLKATVWDLGNAHVWLNNIL